MPAEKCLRNEPLAVVSASVLLIDFMVSMSVGFPPSIVRCGVDF